MTCRLLPKYSYQLFANMPHESSQPIGPNSSGAGRDWANMGWVFLDRGLRLLSGLIVGAWVARYLGPEEFGALSHAMALTAMFGLLLHFGLDMVVLRDLARTPQRRAEILSTHFTLRLGGGVLVIVLVQGVLYFTSAERDLWVLASLISSGMIWRIFELIEIAHNAQKDLRLPATVRTVALLSGAAFKVALICTNGPLWMFGLAAAMDVALTGMLFAVLGYRGQRLWHPWRVSWNYLRDIRGELGLALGASLCMTTLARFDQVWLGFISGEAELGGYSAAVRLVEALQVLPVSMLAVFSPGLFALTAQDGPAAAKATVRMQRIIGGAVLLGALPLFLAAEPLVMSLYGAEFDSTAGMLRGYLWIGLATVILSINSRWLYAHNLAMWNFWLLFLGAMVAVGLNIVLVPFAGAKGALIATVTGFATTAVLAPWVFPAVRPLARLWVAALTGCDHIQGGGLSR